MKYLNPYLTSLKKSIKQKQLLILIVALIPFYTNAQKKQETPFNQSRAIEYKPDTLSMLRNPAMGWVMYEEGWSFKKGKNNPYNPVKFWKEMDAVNASSYSNIFYIRVHWDVMEPEEGKFAWIYNKQYKDYIQKAKDRGLKLAFRVFFDNGVPDFVYQAGAKSTIDPPMNLQNDKQPYYDDPVFLDKLTNFIKAFAKEYDNPDVVDFVDAYGLGRWGEGHGVTLKDPKNLPAVMERVTGDYARNFKKVLTVMNLSQADYQYTKPLVFDKLGFLPRRDGIGSFWFSDKERAIITEMFPGKAHIGEGCYWFNSPIASDTSKYDAFKSDKRFKMNSFKEAFTVAVDDALAYHSNTFDLRVPLQCKFWIEQMPETVQLFISRGGYRLYPSRIEINQTGRRLNINHQWKNYGVGVLPNKHPNWNYKYKVSFALIDKKTNEVKYLFVDNKAEPSDWIKGKTFTYASSLTIPKSVKRGNYILCVGVTDQQKGNIPGIKLAIKDLRKLKSGWLEIERIYISK